MDSVSSFDIRSEIVIHNASSFASTPPSSASQSALSLPASSDDVLRLLASSSIGIDPSRIWKNGASVQLLVPSPSPPPFLPIDDSKSIPAAGLMLPPSAQLIKRPPNPYQLFCHDWRPCLKHLTRLCADDYGFEANRSKILSAVRDENVKRALIAASPDATLSTLLGLAWKSLSEDIRVKYEKRSEELMAQFKRDHVNWRQLLRSPTIAAPGNRKRKRPESTSVVAPTFAASARVLKSMMPASPVAQPDEESSSSTAEGAASDEDDDDGEYKEPSSSRPSKRQRSNQQSAEASNGKALCLSVMEPAAIAVSAATRVSIRESDWAHLHTSLLGSSQAIHQLTSGSA